MFCIGFSNFPVCETLTDKMPDALRFCVECALPQFLQNQPDIFIAVLTPDGPCRRCLAIGGWGGEFTQTGAGGSGGGCWPEDKISARIFFSSFAMVSSPIALISRTIVDKARSASSSEKGSWCAWRFLTSINSLTWARSVRPKALLKAGSQHLFIVCSNVLTSRFRCPLFACNLSCLCLASDSQFSPKLTLNRDST